MAGMEATMSMKFLAIILTSGIVIRTPPPFFLFNRILIKGVFIQNSSNFTKTRHKPCLVPYRWSIKRHFAEWNWRIHNLTEWWSIKRLFAQSLDFSVIHDLPEILRVATSGHLLTIWALPLRYTSIFVKGKKMLEPINYDQLKLIRFMIFRSGYNIAYVYMYMFICFLNFNMENKHILWDFILKNKLNNIYFL